MLIQKEGEIMTDIDLCDYYYYQTRDKAVKEALMKLKYAIIVMEHKSEEL